MSRYFIISLLALSVVSIHCEGPQGPEGKGLDSLNDPSVTPAVIYTYPPANSAGPYPGLEHQYGSQRPDWYVSEVLVRFNKFMDIASVKRSVSLASSTGDLSADSNRIGSVGGDAFSITPMDGDSNTYRSVYRLPFPVGETCTLSISSAAMDIHGNSLVPPYAMTFMPEPYFRVRGIYPPPGRTEVPTAYSSIWLYFNSPVDSGIFSHVTLTPALPGGWRLNGTEIYQYGPWDNSTDYTITVDGSASDRHGNVINAPFSATFRTVKYELTGFRISPTSPDTMNEYSLYSYIYGTFSAELDTAGAGAWVTVVPPTPARVRAIGTDVEVTPTLGWEMSTDYTVRVDSGLRSIAGRTLPRSYEHRFRTQPFRIERTNPADSSQGINLLSQIYIRTNAVLDTSTIRESVHILPDVPVRFYLYDGSTGIEFQPTGYFQSGTWYTVRVDTTLRYKLGHALPEEFTFSFKTQE